MWFKRKPKNRRLGREYVLDVKLRSSQVRAARTRMAAVSLGAVFAAVFGLYLAYRGGEWLLNRLVYENKAFAIEEIDVQTDGVIPVDQLRRWAGVKLEVNLLALDLGRVKRDLEMVPLVRSVSVERVLPRTLRIRVTEREPIAQVNALRPRASGGVETSLYQLDADGWVILPLEPRDRATSPNQSDESLPAISGINANTLQPGRRLIAPQVQAALQFLVAFEESPMAGLVDLKRVDVTAPEVLVLTTGQGSEVTFGLTDFDQQLRRWHAIFKAGRKAGNAIGTLDLAVTNNVPLRWLEASAVPAAAPKLSKPSRSKKKHV
jgi:cell division septal protein FtsQ